MKIKDKLTIKNNILFLTHYTTYNNFKNILSDGILIPSGCGLKNFTDYKNIAIKFGSNKVFTTIICNESDYDDAHSICAYTTTRNTVIIIFNKQLLFDKAYYHINDYDSFGIVSHNTFLSDGIRNYINNNTMHPYTKIYLNKYAEEHCNARKNTASIIKTYVNNKHCFYGVAATTAEFIEPIETKYIIGICIHKSLYIKYKNYFNKLNIPIFTNKALLFYKNIN